MEGHWGKNAEARDAFLSCTSSNTAIIEPDGTAALCLKSSWVRTGLSPPWPSQDNADPCRHRNRQGRLARLPTCPSPVPHLMSPGASGTNGYLKPLALTWASADLAIVSFTVDVVTLAVLPEDHFVGDVTGVAHTLPTDAVPQP